MDELDEHSIVCNLEQSLSILFEDGESDLEENLGSHGNEAVDDSEGEDKRHRVDEETQEPATKYTSDLRASAISEGRKDKESTTNGRHATESETSTLARCSEIIGKHRVTRDSKTRWSRRVPCMVGESGGNR
jgi:hypothetical protein